MNKPNLHEAINAYFAAILATDDINSATLRAYGAKRKENDNAEQKTNHDEPRRGNEAGDARR